MQERATPSDRLPGLSGVSHGDASASTQRTRPAPGRMNAAVQRRALLRDLGQAVLTAEVDHLSSNLAQPNWAFLWAGLPAADARERNVGPAMEYRDDDNRHASGPRAAPALAAGAAGGAPRRCAWCGMPLPGAARLCPACGVAVPS